MLMGYDEAGFFTTCMTCFYVSFTCFDVHTGINVWVLPQLPFGFISLKRVFFAITVSVHLPDKPTILSIMGVDRWRIFDGNIGTFSWYFLHKTQSFHTCLRKDKEGC